MLGNPLVLPQLMKFSHRAVNQQANNTLSMCYHNTKLHFNRGITQKKKIKSEGYRKWTSRKYNHQSGLYIITDSFCLSKRFLFFHSLVRNLIIEYQLYSNIAWKAFVKRIRYNQRQKVQFSRCGREFLLYFCKLKDFTVLSSIVS